MGIPTTLEYLELNTARRRSAGSMQKSKSSSSVVQHGRSLVSKKIWKSRSKSQVRSATATPTPTSVWTPQGHCMWSNVAGRQITLADTNLMELTELERKVLQKVSVAKLHTLNLGTNVKIPSESVGSVSQKPKRRAYLLKRKALTTGFFDTARGKDATDKDKCSGGFVFGIPITQCLENDRLSRSSRNESPLRGRAASDDDQSAELRRQSHHGSRTSFTSLTDNPRAEESGSCESLMGPAERIMAGSLLDTLSCSTLDMCSERDREASIPQIVLLCIRHLENYGLHTLGLFRISSSKKKVRQLREEIDCGKEFVMNEDTCPHVVATLLKEFFRDLPDPLLCRELYHAFVQTQRIRNRRLQHEAMQHLIQLLPVANRDTLSALVSFLAAVAHHSRDTRGPTGEWIYGNKMDSNNLATLIAPNILHCIKPGCAQELSTEGAEERIDVINVVRSMIDHNQDLFTVTAEVLDEVYVHMMDTHPDVLDLLLRKRYYCGDDLDDPECTMEGGVGNESPCRSPSSVAVEPDATATAAGEPDSTGAEPVRRVWSREDFLHESAGMGGPDMAMRPRHKDRDRGRERTSKKRSPATTAISPSQDGVLSVVTGDGITATAVEASMHSTATTITAAYTTMHVRATTTTTTTATRHNRERGEEVEATQKIRSVSVDSGNVTASEELTGKLYKAIDDNERRQSSPMVSDSSGVITASLKIPVPGANTTQSFALNLDDSDIPFIEDGTGYMTAEGGSIQQMTIGLIRGPAAVGNSRPRRQRSASGSDTSSQASTVLPVTGGSAALVQGQGQGYDSAMGSSATFNSPLRNTTPSVCSSSGGEAGPFSSTPSWASTPPTSPDATVTTVNYIPDDSVQQLARFSIPTKASSEDLSGATQTARFSIPTKGTMSYQRGISVTTKELAPVMLQKVTFTSTSELQQVQKCDSAPNYATYQKAYSPGSSGELPKSASTSAVVVNKKVEFEPEREGDRKLTTSISSIGGAVMRSKTADIERMLKLQKDAGKPKADVPGQGAASQDDKKNYAKRRYTDSRHQTRHIPDVEALQSAQNAIASKTASVGDSVSAEPVRPARSRSGPIWKRRELIASDPKEHETFL